MGTDKALIVLDEKPLVRHAVDAMVSAGASEILVVGRAPDFASDLGVATAVPDNYPDEGPLGGLLTAMEHASTGVVVLSPCDLIEASAAAPAAVVQALGDGDVALPWFDGHGHFVQAAFRTTCYEQLRAQFERGVRSIRLAIAELTVVEVLDGEAGWFHDADLPEELPARAHLDT